MRTFIIAAALATFVLGCGNGSDIDELKKGQKDILAKLEGLDKSVQQMKAAPAGGQRPQVDPNKVYTIPIGTSPLHGPKEAKATIVEFADYQCPFCAQAAPLFEQVLKTYSDGGELCLQAVSAAGHHASERASCRQGGGGRRKAGEVLGDARPAVRELPGARSRQAVGVREAPRTRRDPLAEGHGVAGDAAADVSG